MVSAGSMATGGKVSRQFNTIQTVPVDVVRKYESVMLNTRHGVCVFFFFLLSRRFKDLCKSINCPTCCWATSSFTRRRRAVLLNVFIFHFVFLFKDEISFISASAPQLLGDLNHAFLFGQLAHLDSIKFRWDLLAFCVEHSREGFLTSYDQASLLFYFIFILFNPDVV